jgi:nitrogen-specific signal transduction histidine kinase
LKDKLEIKDSGNGIPQKVIDKIFQPFIITKPTGQGKKVRLRSLLLIYHTHQRKMYENKSTSLYRMPICNCVHPKAGCENKI